MVLENILESPLDIRRSNQSISKENNCKYSLKGVMLKLQYYLKRLQCRERLTGKEKGQRRMREFDGIIYSVDRNLGKL